jgi:hypothetical protein
MKRICIFVLTTAIGWGTFAPSGVRRAQGDVTLSGTAMDQTGAVIPGEKLTLLNKTTGETRKTESDQSGHFSFGRVAPGEYVLRGEAEGFNPAELAITVGAKPLTDIKLKMEITISEDVTVNSKEQPELAENNADALNLGNLLGSLPIQMQDILPVLTRFLVPAAMETVGPSIVVDGVEHHDINVPTDAIKTVALNKNPYSAEFRRPGLGRIEVTTRNGSGRYYNGTAELYVRNDSFLGARNAFAKEKTPLDLRLFEARLGGPLPFLNHTTFFLSGNRLIDDETAVVDAVTLSGPLIENVPTFKRNTFLFARIDVKPNKLNKIALTYNFSDQPERNRGVGGENLPEHGISAGTHGNRFQFTDSTAFSKNLLNTLRVTFGRRSKHTGSRANKPEIDVEGAFIGGPSQKASSDQEDWLEFWDTAVYTHGHQTLRVGGAFRRRFFNTSNATGFGGTFRFASLEDFAAGKPTLFDIVQGNTDDSFPQNEAYGFFQDEIKLTQHSSLMLGLRYEWQARLQDYNNFAPRLAFAFAPGKQKTVFRTGAGIFYEKLSSTVTETALLIDGVHSRELVIADPSFPDPFEGGHALLTLPSVWRIDPDIREPYLLQGTLGLERKLGTRTQLSIDYQTLRGVHLFRSRNINAPLGKGGPLPDPNFLLINQVGSSASLRSNALITTLQGSPIHHFGVLAQYIISRTTDDIGKNTFALPANNYDLRPERGRSALDQRQRFNFTGAYRMPWRLRIGGVLSLATGAPFDITTGRDDNRDRTVNDRPPGVTRNTGHGPGYAQLDLRLSKFFPVPTLFRKEPNSGSKAHNLALNIDMFNVLNRNNQSGVIGVLSSPLFGRGRFSLQPRTVQLSFKYDF